MLLKRRLDDARRRCGSFLRARSLRAPRARCGPAGLRRDLTEDEQRHDLRRRIRRQEVGARRLRERRFDATVDREDRIGEVGTREVDLVEGRTGQR